MLRDRFALRRDIKKKAQRSKVAERIDKSVALAEVRRNSIPAINYPDLPVSEHVAEIKKAIQSNQVVIVAGETGSGKTTQLPKICLEAGRGVFGRIGHTQPRRVAARTIANRLAEELDVKVGDIVGHQVRFTDETTANTLIKVMTDGILLAETQNDRFLEAYDTIIIDEAHERSLNIDFLLGYLKRILGKRPDLKVIITSATIDVERFSAHFGNAPIIEVSGRTYPVTVHYQPIEADDADSDEALQAAIVETLQQISAASGKGDVLVFLAGEREIRDVSHAIRKAQLKGFELLPLYSRLNTREQNRVFEEHKGRRIVLATNVAETSLTVPGIHYVIDPGLARISRYSYRSKVQQLPTEPISKASANQRMGRCGRISEGECFRLYSEDDFDGRDEFTTPEILRTNLASVILQMLNLRLGDMSKFPFVERPNPKQVNDGFQLLFELGAVDGKRQITKLGRQLARFPIDLRYARMLLSAAKTGCLSELLVITSGLTIQDPRERPFDHQQAADKAHQQYWDERSDFMALINLWRDIEVKRQDLTQGQFRKFCRQNFLSFMRLREWREIHRQLLLLIKEMKFKANAKPAEYDNIHKAVLSGLLGHVSEKTDEHEYTGARGRKQYIFPGSSQFGHKPKWLVASEIVETSRLYARTVAGIDPRWIEPMAGHLVQRKHHGEHFDPKRGQVLVKEDVMLYGLTVTANRLVPMSGVNPVTAREIFIQKALVEGELQASFDFFTHNRKLIRDIEKIESRVRRRDLLVEAQVLYDFYDRQLPADVYSEIDLGNFVKRGNAGRALRLTKEALLQQESLPSGAAFPEQIKVNDTSLKLKYKFEPGRADDGATVDLPLAMLNQVSRAELDWVIPGLMPEKCLAMIKSLRKSLRKQFVPAPDYVERVLEDFEFTGKDLPTALAERLFRISGTRVTADDFNEAALAEHLKINIRVRDHKGKVIETGRDLDALIDKLGEKMTDAFEQRDNHAIERSGVTRWDFDELPVSVKVKQGRLMVDGYVALIDKGDSVDVSVMFDPGEAKAARQRGMMRLYMLHLADQVKFLSQNIPGFDRFSLYYATRGDRKTFTDNIVKAAFYAVFVEDRPEITSRQVFEDSLARKSMLFELLEQIAKVIGETLPKGLAIEESLGKQRSAHNQETMDDIKVHLDSLFGGSFPFGVPMDSLRQYHRYLKGIEYRLDKLQGNLEKDRAAVASLQPHLQRLSDSGEAREPGMLRYRWMLEEYRISLFAQAIGTRHPVSGKRLEKLWQEVQGNKA